MSWETIESLPNEPRVAADVGPFRAQSEPVLATRTPPTWLERARLSFGSTPELPSKRAGHDVLVTAEFVYVRRADGTRQRVPRAALSGRREELGRIIYGVRDDEDLALLHRPSCPVQAALDAQLTADAEAQPLHTNSVPSAALQAFLAGLVLFIAGWNLEPLTSDLGALVRYPASAPWLYLIATLFGAIALFHALFLRAVRHRLDRVGLHRRFGLLHLFHEQLPIEAFTAVEVFSTDTAFSGVWRRVQLQRDKGRAITLTSFSDAALGTRALDLANDTAVHVTRILGVPFLPHRWGWKPKK